MVAERLVVLGSRSFAEEVTDLAGQCGGYEVAAFGENWDPERCAESLLGRPVIWIDELAPLAADHRAVCALGTTRRRGFIEQAAGLGFRFATLVHPSAVVSPSARLGAGAIVGAGVVIAAEARIGEHVILNRGVLVGHHTTIEDYCTLCPAANIAGRVSIGEQTYVGMSAAVLDRKTVGRDVLVGAGTLVTRDVADRAHVLGVPARVVREDIEGH